MLYLFSSNAQPQYAQDILNVLAAPQGYRVTFRYDTKYVAVSDWRQLATDRPDVLVHFVLQQPHQYFMPVLFPLRVGKVVNARREGRIHLVDFTVGDFVSLSDPDPPNSYPARTEAYRQLLEKAEPSRKKQPLPLPYDKYAVLSDYNVLADAPRAQLVRGSSAESIPAVFRSSTEYLVRTETFASARFAYVSNLHRQGQSRVRTIDASSYGFKLTAGEEYELEFLQAQPHLIATASTMSVVFDGKVLQPIGPSELTIGSPYDVQSIRIGALPATGVQYTTIGLRPAGSLQGPILDIPVEVRPPRAKNAVVATGTAAGLVLLGLSSFFTTATGLEKLGLVAGGSLLASLLNAFRLSNKSL